MNLICAVCCTVAARPFTMDLTPLQGGSSVYLERPCRLPFLCICRPEVFVHLKSHSGSRPLGRIKYPCYVCPLFGIRFDIYEHGRPERSYTADGCCLMPLSCRCLNFSLAIKNNSGQRVGTIKRSFGDLVSELCCNGEQYKVIFPDGATDDQRALLIGLAMMFDQMFYRKNCPYSMLI